MINCPKCHATLPDGSGRCQFCSATFAAAPKRADAEEETPGQPLNLKWVWPAYFGIAGWWIFNGLYDIAQTLLTKQGGSLFGIIGIVFSIITVLVGIGLVARVELARGIVNVLCFLQILSGIFGAFGGFVFTFVLPVFGVIAMIMSVLKIALAVLMIFVIGETETRAANF